MLHLLSRQCAQILQYMLNQIHMDEAQITTSVFFFFFAKNYILPSNIPEKPEYCWNPFQVLLTVFTKSSQTNSRIARTLRRA